MICLGIKTTASAYQKYSPNVVVYCSLQKLFLENADQKGSPFLNFEIVIHFRFLFIKYAQVRVSKLDVCSRPVLSEQNKMHGKRRQIRVSKAKLSLRYHLAHSMYGAAGNVLKTEVLLLVLYYIFH